MKLASSSGVAKTSGVEKQSGDTGKLDLVLFLDGEVSAENTSSFSSRFPIVRTGLDDSFSQTADGLR